MDCRCALRSLLLCLCLVFGNAASASSEFVREIQTRLYAGEIDKAAESAKARVIAAPADENARFALGAVQFLKAVEQLGQMLHRYGLHSTYKDHHGLTGFPILRLPVPDNPNPEELTYEKFRNILKTFVANLEIAEATLAQIKSERVNFPLDIGRIRLDLNGDGKGGEHEAFWRIFAVVAGAGQWLREGTAPKLLTDFDHSDIPWLRAYCHLLMAISEFPLAHDWQRAFETTFPSIFHMPKSAAHRKAYSGLAEARARLAQMRQSDELAKARAVARARYAEARARQERARREARARLAEIGPLPPHPYVNYPGGMSFAEWYNSAEYKKKLREHLRIRKLQEPYKLLLQKPGVSYQRPELEAQIEANATDIERQTESEGIADLIAFVHLMHCPVVERERMASVLRHLEAMVGLSRENWNRIVAETDNAHVTR